MSVVLEPAAQEFANGTANPPFLFELPPVEGRKAVDEAQTTDYPKLPVDEEWIILEDGTLARIVKPQGATGVLPAILYIHGAGSGVGSAHTHDRRFRELAVGPEAAVVLPAYDLSPEACYPRPNEQNCAVANWIVPNGKEKGLDAEELAIAAGSVGGNMSAALTLL